MSASKSVLDLLTARNPDIEDEMPDSKTLTTNHTYATPRELKRWDEFNFQTLEAMYGGALMRDARQRSSPLPALPHLSPHADCVVGNEETTQHILTKWNHTIVQAALDTVREPFRSCVWTPGRRLGAKAARSTPSHGNARPGGLKGRHASNRRSWRGLKPDAGAVLPCRTHGSSCAAVPVERLPKDYKTAAKWKSSAVLRPDMIDEAGRWMKGASRQNVAMPIRQAFTYCVHFRCRYGCILTTHEAFIFRIRPRTAAPDATGSPRPNNGTLDHSIQQDGLMEYVTIPWKGHRTQDADTGGALTVNLALWFIHILAGNHHEVGWDYRPLASEELAADGCPAPTAPVTPESQSGAPMPGGLDPCPRGASRKRRRSDTDDAAIFSSFKSQTLMPRLPDRDTDTSEPTDGDSLFSLVQGEVETAAKAKQEPLAGSPEDGVSRLRRSRRRARYGL